MSPTPRSAPPNFTDHTFPSTSGVPLSVRVWPATAPLISTPAPFILLTHGGGLLAGQHYIPPPWPFPGFRARGYHLVSHSYRLGPQARLDEQLADCLEAVAWCRGNLEGILGEGKVDVDRYVLYGDSAGGLLVALMGLELKSPPPRAVVNVYGVVDFPGLLAEEERAPEKEAVPWTGEFGEDELEAFLCDRDPANVLTASTAWREMEEFDEDEFSRLLGTEFRYTKRVRLQAELHIWRSMHPRGAALLTTAVMHPEKFEDEEKLREFSLGLSPLQVLRRRQAEGDDTGYPPTAFLHGTGDTAVPVQQSYDMARTLREMGVPVVEQYEEGEEHVFDHKYTVRSPWVCLFPWVNQD